MPKRKAVVIAITSDLHAGSTVALCPPHIQLDDGGEYHASKAQRWLWDCWTDFWRKVDAERVTQKAELYQVYNGDLVDGNHHGTTQILSGNPTAQAAVVNAILAVPMALKPDKIWFIRGTEAHVGPSAAFEERIALGLSKDRRPVVKEDSGNASHWHVKLDVQGYRMDFAHHGRVGTRPWTKPNVVMNLAAEIFYQHAESEQPYPHLAVRSHMHQFVDTGTAHKVRVVQTPAYQLATAYIHRIAPGVIADVGGIIVTILDGQATVRPVLYHPDPTPTWRA
jgi:hypothetical protein